MNITTSLATAPAPDATVTSPMTSSLTSPMTSSSVADESSCRLYDFVVCTVLIGAFCVFGLIGNATSFVVFYDKRTDGRTDGGTGKTRNAAYYDVVRRLLSPAQVRHCGLRRPATAVPGTTRL